MAARRLADVVGPLADDVLPQLVELRSTLSLDSVLPSGHTVELAPLAGMAPKLDAIGNQVDLHCVSQVETIDLTGLSDSAALEVGAAHDRLQTAKDQLQVGSGLVGKLPAILGFDGPRTYLLVFQNNAEVRATGGMFGSFAVVTADHGTISLGDPDRSSRELPTLDAPLPGYDPGLISFYGDLVARDARYTNLTPDFPTAARSFADDLPAAHRHRRWTGCWPPTRSRSAICSAGRPRSTSARASGWTRARPRTSSCPASTPSSAPTPSRGRPSPRTPPRSWPTRSWAAVSAPIWRRACDVAWTRHRILAWSAHQDEEQVIAGTGVGGAVANEPGSTDIGVFLNDGSGVKLSYYLYPSLTVTAGECTGAGVRRVTVQVALQDASPSSGLTDYVASWDKVPPYVLRTTAVVMVPTNGTLVSAAQDGQPAAVTTGVDHGRSVAAVTVDLQPGQSSTLTYQMDVPVTGSAVTPTLHFTPLRQPWDGRRTRFRGLLTPDPAARKRRCGAGI